MSVNVRINSLIGKLIIINADDKSIEQIKQAVTEALTNTISVFEDVSVSPLDTDEPISSDLQQNCDLQ